MYHLKYFFLFFTFNFLTIRILVIIIIFLFVFFKFTITPKLTEREISIYDNVMFLNDPNKNAKSVF